MLRKLRREATSAPDKEQITTLGCGKHWLPAIEHAKICFLVPVNFATLTFGSCFLVRYLHFYSIYPLTSMTLLTQFSIP